MDAALIWLTQAEYLGLAAYVWLAVLLVLVVAAIVLIALVRKGRKGKSMAKAAKAETPPRTLEPRAPGQRLEIANVHGIGARSYQQDAFAVSPLSDASLCERSGVLLVLADGMGGMTDGGKASAIVVETLMRGFAEETLMADPAVALASLLYRAGDKVLKLDNSGSTAIAAVVRGSKLHFAACGDSRLALYRGGALLLLNREQNYAGLLDDRAARGDIPYEEAAQDPQRQALTSYVGSARIKVDRSLLPVTLCAGDMIVLMSDGVYNALSEEELNGCFARGLYGAAEEIESAILSKNLQDQDNFTAILAKFNG